MIKEKASVVPFEKNMNSFRPSRIGVIAAYLTITAHAWAVDVTGSYRALVEDGIQRVQILGGSYFFKPKHVIVKTNIPVELTVRREAGLTPHNLVLKAPEAGIAIDEALDTDPKRITFTPTAPGKYMFYCDKRLLFFQSHRDKGMEGMLEVVR
jgi:plastocyanin domain-containing protein